VVREIDATAAGRASAHRVDLLQGGFDALVRAAPWPDVVWYFATPRIFRKHGAIFNATLFGEFLHFYVDRFAGLCLALEEAAVGRSVRVFCPSTAFLDQRPKGMTEYTMAKAAAEVLVTDLARTLRLVRPMAFRLPRLATDQTAGVDAGGAPKNAVVLLPLLRQVLTQL
jgi:hypothetical protein